MKAIDIGSDLEYTAEFESMPTVEPVDLATLTIKKPKVELAEKEIEEIIQSQLKQSPDWIEKSNQKVAEGLKVQVDFDGTVNGKPFTGGQGEGIDLVIGDGKFLKDFEQGVIGMSPSEQKEIEVTFPEDYHQKTLAGKPAVFQVVIKKVWTPKVLTTIL